jgi:hypothetical protein
MSADRKFLVVASLEISQDDLDILTENNGATYDEDSVVIQNEITSWLTDLGFKVRCVALDEDLMV